MVVRGLECEKTHRTVRDFLLTAFVTNARPCDGALGLALPGSNRTLAELALKIRRLADHF